MSRAILPTEPASTATAQAKTASRSRWACQGASGTRQTQRRAQRTGNLRPLVPQRRERPDRTAELQQQRLVRRLTEPRRTPRDTSEPPSRLQAEGDRRPWLQQRAAQHGRIPVLAREATQR